MIAVDRPGYGKSKVNNTVLPDIEKQAEIISAVIPKNEKQKVIVAGRSYGAPVAAMMAQQQSNIVSGVLLISPAADPEHEKFWWFSKPVYYPPLRWLFPNAVNTASDEKFLHRNQLNKILLKWEKITQPSIILQGDKDFIIHKNNVCFLDSLMISSPREYQILENTGHLITKERPEIVKECIQKLVSSPNENHTLKNFPENN
jgi:pimeloyl-ACP methyl ester carboxylesterase